jgi:hypothetical protein
MGMSLQDVLGSTGTMVSGLAATSTSSLVVNLAAGRIYQQAAVDATAFGTIGLDARVVEQQGIAAAQSLTFSLTGIAAGQSRYALVQAKFTQTDVIPSDDPNSGVLPYYNVNNPISPLTGAAQNTRRTGVCTVAIKYGAVATTGSEVAPTADSGYVGLYLVDLAYGQTQITQGQIVVATGAPFLAGLLASHHSGSAGQAPKISLTSEVQGVLPLANLPSYTMAKLPVSSAAAGSGISACYGYAGNPNTHVAGVAAVAGVSPPDYCLDITNVVLYICTTSGAAAAAVWTPFKAVTKASGTNTTEVATTAFVQQEISGNARVFCYPDITYANGDHNTAAHGVAMSKVLSVVASMVCISADQGYAIGDVAPPNSDSVGSGNDHGLTVVASNTNVKWSVSTNGIFVTSYQSGPGNATLDPTKWKIRVVVTYLP